MEDLLLVYTTWESVEQAKKAAIDLLNKRVCACVNIYPEMYPMFFGLLKKRRLMGQKKL